VETQLKNPQEGLVSPGDLVIEAIDLRRTYRVGAHQEVQALRGVNLKIFSGECVAVKGRSGSGKTTMLNCIGGLDRPTSGTVRVFGQDLTKLVIKSLHYHRFKSALSSNLWPDIHVFSIRKCRIIVRIAGSGLASAERALHCLDLLV
jgi:ABC-type transporter Mla maintaining outer membrane lipid asymmetry ATPase subunit MlaF